MIADTDILNLLNVPLEFKQLLPEYSGIYYVLDETNLVWYIGQAKNIHKRWQGKAHHRIYQLNAQKKNNFTIYYEQVSESELDKIEKQRIKQYHPHLNASPVKTRKVRPTETLLRETIAAIADFAFILGVEPPRKEVESKINNYYLAKAEVMELSVIHICLDLDSFKKKFKLDIGEQEALIKSIFKTRKTYSRKWEGFPPVYSFMYRLLVNGYAIEVNYSSIWEFKEESEIIKEYNLTTLANQSLRALKPECLAKLQEQANKNKSYYFYLKRLVPYTSDLIRLLFNEPIDEYSIRQKLEQLSQDYKQGKRGVGSRSKPTNLDFTIDELLVTRGIDTQKYSRGGVRRMSRPDRIGLYIRCFSVDLKQPYIYTSTFGLINNRETESSSRDFDIVYLLSGVKRKAWLLIESYLQDFAKPALQLNNGEGYTEKFYVSARKYLTPTKRNPSTVFQFF